MRDRELYLYGSFKTLIYRPWTRLRLVNEEALLEVPKLRKINCDVIRDSRTSLSIIFFVTYIS